MLLPRKDGSSLYNNLIAVEGMGEQVPELQAFKELEYPDDLIVCYQRFLEIGRRRSFGMNGPDPLSWQEIHSWIQVSSTPLNRLEAKIITELDEIWMKVYGELNPPAKPKK